MAEKGKTKTKDEAKRAEVTTKITNIFTAAEADVKKILDGIDPKVEKEFNDGEAKARSVFESYVAAKMSAYKKDRYSGWLGGLRWAKDKLVGMPDKVNEFYEAGRELYLKQMDGVISRVADIVGGDLTAAKMRIARGKAEIASYVKSLPKDLQKVGSEASKEIGERFEQLESEVNDKQDSVVDTLATKYVEARKGLDERIAKLQEENKGLVDKAIGAIKAVINTIRELVAMLKGVLARVADVIGAIIKNPIGFLGNLIAGIKGGIAKFADNILTHLRKGLMSWLFGALAEAGIELPDSFDLKGIIKLLASIFGFTWANIRNRIVKQIGEKAMAAIEKGVEIFSVLATQGVSGLWQMLLEKLGDIKEMILEQVKDFVITKIITAGITWLIGLLNPAAAFIKACKLIYDVVMFFVNNAARIKAFVDSVIDSVADVVKGNVGGVINKINDVLGQMVPILIGFLASVIGLGGIGQKIREIITKLQKPVNDALDFVIKKGLQLAAPIIRGLKGVGRKVKAKVEAGRAYVKGKVEAGKAWAKEKVASVKAKVADRFGPRDRKARPGEKPAPDTRRNTEIGAAAVKELRNPPAGPGSFLTRMQHVAAALPGRYRPLLAPGLRLSVDLTPQGEAAAHYRVVIAPNDSVFEGNAGDAYDPSTRTMPQLWRDMNTDQLPGESPEQAAERSRKARAHLAANQFAAKAGIFNAMTDPAYGYGARPRPFVSYEDEKLIDTRSHVGEKHVLGDGYMRNDELVALRALKKKIFKDGAWVNTTPTSTSSVFATPRDATAALRSFYNQYLVKDWEHARLELLTADYKKYPDLDLPSRAVSYTKAVTGPWSDTRLPRYLNGRYTFSGCVGTDPLYPGDPRITTGTPMTTMDFPQTFLVAIRPSATARGGWYIDSAYPKE